MDKIKVNLLYYTPAELLVKAIEKPYANDKASLSTVRKVCYDLKHESVLEHAVFTFEILSISRLCLQELARHRIASFTVESTRYTLKKLLDTMIDIDNIDEFCVYPDCEEDLLNDIKVKNVESLSIIKKNIKKGVKNDVLKYALPENYRTNLMFTINLRSFENFIRLRTSDTAHFEISHLAKSMDTIIHSLDGYKEIRTKRRQNERNI